MFERLNFLKKYNKVVISLFNSDNKIIILTNQEGFDYASKVLKPNSQIHHIVETNNGGRIEIKNSMKVLRRKFGIKKILNDGDSEISEGMKNLGMLINTEL